MTRDADTVAQILIIEDNPADARLTQEALRRTDLAHEVTVAADGDEALELLRADGAVGRGRPDLILLDWNLPGRHGREVLTAIKSDERLRRIPVVVLTSSAAERDVREAYDLHANCFCAKPLRLDDFVAVVTAIERFWFGIAETARG